MSDLPPSRRDEREAKLAAIFAEARRMADFTVVRTESFMWLLAEVKSLGQQLDEAKADSARLDFLFAQVAFGVTLPDHDGSVGRDYRLGDVEGSPREQMDEWMRIREQYV